MKLLIHTIALNRADLLKQMVDSIDTKHDWRLYIHVVSNDKDIQEYLRITGKPSDGAWCQLQPEGRIFANIVGYNIGVAQCWNDALQIGYEENYADRILFVNSDIKFGPGDIDKMLSFSEAKLDKLITITGSHGKHKDKWDGMDLSHGFAAAVLPPKIFEEVGYFDENFFPAYNEDCDYFTRLWLHRRLGAIRPRFDKISDKNSPIVECVKSGHTHHEGSCVIYSDSRMMELNRVTHGQNNKYYMGKWGGLNDHEVYTKPFDELDSFRIDKENRHNPYPDYWDRTREKQNYYQIK